jgi:hypothetical protein
MVVARIESGQAPSRQGCLADGGALAGWRRAAGRAAPALWRQAIGLALLAIVAFSVPAPASAAWRGGWGWGGGWGGGWAWHGGWGWHAGWGWPGYSGAYWGIYPAWYPGYAANYPYVNPYYYPYTVYRYATYPAAVYAPTTYFGPSSYAQPIAAPAVMPEPRPFIVFFDFDKANLTPAGMQILDQAVAAAKRGGVTHVQITGYTDAAGTIDYNLGLSRRRAETVRAYMKSHGVAGDEIGVGWLGKEHQRVKTADGVREPQNRRVEISLAPPSTVQNEPPRPMPPRPGLRSSGVVPPSNLMVASAKGGDCREVPTADGQNHAMMCRQFDGTWKTVR